METFFNIIVIRSEVIIFLLQNNPIISPNNIDKFFVNDIHAEENDSQVTLSVILILTEKSGIKCIAGGVETQKQVDYFKSQDIYGMQGYYFYKPMLDTDLTDIVCNLQNRGNE